jgi:hypothetical protein
MDIMYETFSCAVKQLGYFSSTAGAWCYCMSLLVKWKEKRINRRGFTVSVAHIRLDLCPFPQPASPEHDTLELAYHVPAIYIQCGRASGSNEGLPLLHLPTLRCQEHSPACLLNTTTMRWRRETRSRTSGDREQAITLLKE